MSPSPIIVVGTTPDYVVRILKKRSPGSVLFIIDSCHLDAPLLSGIENSCLLFAELKNYDGTLAKLKEYLSQYQFSNPAFACFDCEYLILASRLAHYYGSSFPPVEAIFRTRSKFLSRKIWRMSGLVNPQAGLVNNLEETLKYFTRFKEDIVLKPISGSGSELVFRCLNKVEVRDSVKIMEEQLEKRRSNPLFRPIKDPYTSVIMDPCDSWIVEEHVSGPEFSCDFVLYEDNIKIIRETEKIRADDQTFGSIMAYSIPPVYPNGFHKKYLYGVFLLAAKSLGYRWGHFMVDFIIQENNVIILELAPRPGGDSIPDLLDTATGKDLLEDYLNFMSGHFDASITVSETNRPYASVNLFAPGSGLIDDLDASEIMARPEVTTLFLKKKTGDRVALPPDDYDNRLLGYCILHHDADWDPISACRQFQKLLRVSIRN